MPKMFRIIKIMPLALALALLSFPALSGAVTTQAIDAFPSSPVIISGLSTDTLLYIALFGLMLVLAEAVVPTFGLMGLVGFGVFIWAAYALHLEGALPGILIALGLAAACITIACAVMTWKAYARKTTTGAESLIGSAAKVLEWNGCKGRVTVQGETWQAESDVALILNPDETVTIEAVEHPVLRIGPAPHK